MAPPSSPVGVGAALPHASAIEKLPPRPAPTSAYVWNEWSPNATMIYLRDAEAANASLAQLQPGCIGFDLEWKPTYVKGVKENPVALVQLANDAMVYLVQVSAMKEFPSKLRQILEDSAFVKVGVGIQGDTKKLFVDWGVSVRNCVDLSLLAKSVDNARWKGKYNSPIGLARLVEVYCYRLLIKGKITRSNWESELKPAQQLYACNDAHAGYTVHNCLIPLIDSALPPEIKYYTFDCVRGYYCEPSGLPWSPANPNYDPGPPPTPRPPRDKLQPSQTNEVANDQLQPAPMAPDDPKISVQRYESVLKLAHSTWLRKQDASAADGHVRGPRRMGQSNPSFTVPQPLWNTTSQASIAPPIPTSQPEFSAGSSVQGVPSPNYRSNYSEATSRRGNGRRFSRGSNTVPQEEQSQPTPAPSLRPDKPPRHNRYRNRRPKQSTPQPPAV